MTIGSRVHRDESRQQLAAEYESMIRQVTKGSVSANILPGQQLTGLQHREGDASMLFHSKCANDRHPGWWSRLSRAEGEFRRVHFARVMVTRQQQERAQQLLG